MGGGDVGGVLEVSLEDRGGRHVGGVGWVLEVPLGVEEVDVYGGTGT